MKKMDIGVSLLCLSLVSASAFANPCTDHLDQYVSVDGTILSLSNCSLNDKLLTDKVIPFLNAHPAINWLYMPYNNVDATGLQNLVINNSTLTKLDVSFNKSVGAKGASYLAKKTNLIELSMWGDAVGVLGVLDLAASRSLQILDLGENNIGLKGIQGLAINQTLQYLGLSENNLNHNETAALGNSKTLQTLDVSNNNLYALDAANLAAIPSLTNLDISNNHLYDQGAKNLATSHLQELYISNNNLTFKGADYIADITSLETLDISSNSIKAEGIASIATLLTHLQWLDADGDSITSAATLANLLSLNFLDLDGNPLDSDTGVKLAKDRSLTNLYLAKTGLTDTSAYQFATNDTLWQLDVSNNPGLSANAITAMQSNPNFSLPDHWLWTNGDNASAISTRHVLPDVAKLRANCINKHTTFCENVIAVIKLENQTTKS